jgi:sugar/nucleoside kinase (ribokinase family)
MSLLVVGSVAFDAIETPYAKSDRIIGGSGSYAAIAASFFAPVRLVSVVGEDFPVSSLQDFQNRGVDLEGLQIKAGQKSFFWHGKYHQDLNSRDSLATELNVLADFDPIIPPSFADSPYLMLGNLAPSVQRLVLERMSQRPKFVLMDTMNFWMDVAYDELVDMIARVDAICVNDSEARQLSGEYSLVKAARTIKAMGAKTVIIKKGEHGALLFGEDGQVFSAPGLPIAEVFDPTGAGDTFAAGLMGFVAKTENTSFDGLKTALVYGSALASFCVERFGTARLETLTHEQIGQRVREFVELAHFNV